MLDEIIMQRNEDPELAVMIYLHGHSIHDFNQINVKAMDAQKTNPFTSFS